MVAAFVTLIRKLLAHEAWRDALLPLISQHVVGLPALLSQLVTHTPRTPLDLLLSLKLAAAGLAVLGGHRDTLRVGALVEMEAFSSGTPMRGCIRSVDHRQGMASILLPRSGHISKGASGPKAETPEGQSEAHACMDVNIMSLRVLPDCPPPSLVSVMNMTPIATPIDPKVAWQSLLDCLCLTHTGHGVSVEGEMHGAVVAMLLSQFQDMALTALTHQTQLYWRGATDPITHVDTWAWYLGQWESAPIVPPHPVRSASSSRPSPTSSKRLFSTPSDMNEELQPEFVEMLAPALLMLQEARKVLQTLSSHDIDSGLHLLQYQLLQRLMSMPIAPDIPCPSVVTAASVAAVAEVGIGSAAVFPSPNDSPAAPLVSSSAVETRLLATRRSLQNTIQLLVSDSINPALVEEQHAVRIWEDLMAALGVDSLASLLSRPEAPSIADLKSTMYRTATTHTRGRLVNHIRDFTVQQQPQQVASLRQFDFLDCRDSYGDWYLAQILRVELGMDNLPKRFLVHFLAWDDQYNESIDIRSERARIASLFDSTKRRLESDRFIRTVKIFGTCLWDMPDSAVTVPKALLAAKVSLPDMYSFTPTPASGDRLLEIGAHVVVTSGAVELLCRSLGLGVLEEVMEYILGDRMMVMDTVNKLCEAEVIDVRGETEIRIHYIGWAAKWDEWIAVTSSRIKSRRGPAQAQKPTERSGQPRQILRMVGEIGVVRAVMRIPAGSELRPSKRKVKDAEQPTHEVVVQVQLIDSELGSALSFWTRPRLLRSAPANATRKSPYLVTRACLLSTPTQLVQQIEELQACRMHAEGGKLLMRILSSSHTLPASVLDLGSPLSASVATTPFIGLLTRLADSSLPWCADHILCPNKDNKTGFLIRQMYERGTLLKGLVGATCCEKGPIEDDLDNRTLHLEPAEEAAFTKQKIAWRMCCEDSRWTLPADDSWRSTGLLRSLSRCVTASNSSETVRWLRGQLRVLQGRLNASLCPAAADVLEGIASRTLQRGSRVKVEVAHGDCEALLVSLLRCDEGPPDFFDVNFYNSETGSVAIEQMHSFSSYADPSTTMPKSFVVPNPFWYECIDSTEDAAKTKAFSEEDSVIGEDFALVAVPLEWRSLNAAFAFTALVVYMQRQHAIRADQPRMEANDAVADDWGDLLRQCVEMLVEFLGFMHAACVWPSGVKERTMEILTHAILALASPLSSPQVFEFEYVSSLYVFDFDCVFVTSVCFSRSWIEPLVADAKLRYENEKDDAPLFSSYLQRTVVRFLFFLFF
jgi:hypothetical protein